MPPSRVQVFRVGGSRRGCTRVTIPPWVPSPGRTEAVRTEEPRPPGSLQDARRDDGGDRTPDDPGGP